MIADEETDRALVWDDFRGKRNFEVSYVAHTDYDIYYEWDSAYFVHDTAHFNYRLRISFNPNNSWVKKSQATDALLRHEQLHFDIGKLCAWEIMDKMKKQVFFRKNYEEKIDEIFKTAMDKYSALQELYDAETNNGDVPHAQRRWEELVAKRIAEAKARLGYHHLSPKHEPKHDSVKHKEHH
jgi:hypothetical protein